MHCNIVLTIKINSFISCLTQKIKLSKIKYFLELDIDKIITDKN